MAAPRPETTDAKAHTPFAGCFIFIAAGVVMIFLIAFSVYVLFRQAAEIEKFTEAEAAPRPVLSVQAHEAELHDLSRTLEAFRQHLGGDEPASLRLTPHEINLAIAAYEPLNELRGTFEVAAIDDEHMDILISFPLNGRTRLARDDEPGWTTSEKRHLNATLRARPALMQGEIILEILEIRPSSGADVPKEFIELMSPYRITQTYLPHEVIGPAMAALTRIELNDGALVFIREPGVAPVDAVSDEEVNRGARRFFMFFGIGATVFLAFAGTVVLIGLRNAKKRDNPT